MHDSDACGHWAVGKFLSGLLGLQMANPTCTSCVTSSAQDKLETHLNIRKTQTDHEYWTKCSRNQLTTSVKWTAFICKRTSDFRKAYHFLHPRLFMVVYVLGVRRHSCHDRSIVNIRVILGVFAGLQYILPEPQVAPKSKHFQVSLSGLIIRPPSSPCWSPTPPPVR